MKNNKKVLSKKEIIDIHLEAVEMDYFLRVERSTYIDFKYVLEFCFNHKEEFLENKKRLRRPNPNL
jgi:hypothetical protein